MKRPQHRPRQLHQDSVLQQGIKRCLHQEDGHVGIREAPVQYGHRAVAHHRPYDIDVEHRQPPILAPPGKQRQHQRFRDHARRQQDWIDGQVAAPRPSNLNLFQLGEDAQFSTTSSHRLSLVCLERRLMTGASRRA
jgi:hypothetical protein